MSRLLDARDPGALAAAAELLRAGGIVAFPTETVYGLGAIFDNQRAVARVFEVKGRPRFDPVIVHVSGPEWLERLVREVPGPARRLIERFWPGPLTLVLPRRPAVPDIVTAGLDTVAVRAPSHPVASRLIELTGAPLAAPSANRFGRLSPVDAGEVLRQLPEGPDAVLDGGRTPVGVESTVIGFAAGRPVLLRPGGLPVEEIERVAGKVGREERAGRPRAPGQLPRHYAPEQPLLLVDRLEEVAPAERAGAAALAFRRRPLEGFLRVEALTEAGDLREAACNLFAALSRLARSGASRIYAEKVPEEGLGRAIMDRLRRAGQDTG